MSAMHTWSCKGQFTSWGGDTWYISNQTLLIYFKLVTGLKAPWNIFFLVSRVSILLRQNSSFFIYIKKKLEFKWCIVIWCLRLFLKCFTCFNINNPKEIFENNSLEHPQGVSLFKINPGVLNFSRMTTYPESSMLQR